MVTCSFAIDLGNIDLASFFFFAVYLRLVGDCPIYGYYYGGIKPTIGGYNGYIVMECNGNVSQIS